MGPFIFYATNASLTIRNIFGNPIAQADSGAEWGDYWGCGGECAAWKLGWRSVSGGRGIGRCGGRADGAIELSDQTSRKIL